MALPAPVVFLPGIMGSTLRDEYPVSPENVWSIGRYIVKSYERVTLHPDNLRYEVKGPSRIVKDQVFELFYKEMIEELRYNLSPSPEEPVPVFPFAYDWRQPLEVIQEQLADFIEEVVERTSLLRHYHNQVPGYDKASGKVSLVAHSMGGLIAAGYVRQHGLGRIDKIATLASPFRGSIEAIAKTTLGTSGFTFGFGSSREREAARVTPSLYHLLPSFPGAVKPAARDVFKTAAWQPGILDTIAGFIRQHGLQATQPAQQATQLLAGMLDEAWSHREGLESLDLDDSKRWLSIVGVGAKTRLSVKIADDANGRPQFVLGEETDRWKPKAPSTDTGDNTVPYLGARCAFVPPEEVVCVSPGDFGFMEFGDKLISELGFHSAIPNMDLAQRLVISHLLGRPFGKLGGHPSPEIAAKDWDPPVPGLGKK